MAEPASAEERDQELAAQPRWLEAGRGQPPVGDGQAELGQRGQLVPGHGALRQQTQDGNTVVGGAAMHTQQRLQTPGLAPDR